MMTKSSNITSKIVADYWNFLVLNGLLMPSEQGSKIFHTILLPQYLYQLGKMKK